MQEFTTAKIVASDWISPPPRIDDDELVDLTINGGAKNDSLRQQEDSSCEFESGNKVADDHQHTPPRGHLPASDLATLGVVEVAQPL